MAGMRSRSRIIVAASLLAAVAVALSARAAEPEKAKSRIKESAYYEFRGHMSDRNTLDGTFTLGWNKGSQVIVITPETKVFRKGRPAKLHDTKTGDACRGVGKVIKGKLVAIAVAFGSEGVELPSGLKLPESITTAPNTGE